MGSGDRVLLHVCCGICSLSVIERLREEGYRVTLFFYNPNIHPREEYEKRKEVFLEVSKITHTPFLLGEYEDDKWREAIRGWEEEPEGGKRCEICIYLRLRKTFEIAEKNGFSLFTTTLTVSPHKNASLINRLGKSISEEKFLVRDFKKRDGFKRTIELAKKFSLYRQDYCGCVFSKRK